MNADYWTCAVCGRRVSRQSHHAELRVRRMFGGWDHAKRHEPSDENKSRRRVIAATARIDRPTKPSKTRKLKQHREIQAWRRRAEKPAETGDEKGSTVLMTTTDTVADVITQQRITACATSYPDDAAYPQLAGRTFVTIKTAGILTPDDLDDNTDDLDLTIETAVVLARRLLMAAGAAMHHDPGPWRMTQTDMDVLQAAVDAHNTDVLQARAAEAN